MAGAFLNFPLFYKSKSTPDGLSNDGQAVAILKKASELIDEGFPGVAITYSANQLQTIALEKAYAAGQYKADIHGANQAEVMEQFEAHLGNDFTELQMKARIAPITTIPGPKTDPIAIVKDDLARIKKLLGEGWAILGWQNQKTVKNPDKPYAIGGGVMTLSKDVDDAIQGGLKSLAAEFPPPGS